jgi:NAD-dependent deacetylase
VKLDSLPPLCRCRGVLKPTVVFFGEPIPWGAHLQAMEEARDCEVMLVIGTSAVVSPACDIPVMAKNAGAVVVEVNMEETQLTRYVSDWILQGSAARTLQAVLDRVAGLGKS